MHMHIVCRILIHAALHIRKLMVGFEYYEGYEENVQRKQSQKVHAIEMGI